MNEFMKALSKARKAKAKTFKYKGKTYGRFTTKAKTSGTELVYYAQVNSNGKKMGKKEI